MKKIFLIIVTSLLVLTYFGLSSSKVSAEMIQSEEDLYSYFEDLDFIQTDLGDYHSLAITSDGRIFAWGANYDGQLGDGTTTERYLPIEITSNFALNNEESIIDMSVGYEHSAVLTSEGRVFTWGVNDVGQLGDGTTINKDVPTDITTNFILNLNETIIEVIMGGSHSSVLTSEGRVFTWGDNGRGQLGDGTTINKDVPIDISTNFTLNLNETIIEVIMGGSYSAALTSEGRIFTWGFNIRGQLGDGTIINKDVPTDISTNLTLNLNETIIEVILGGSHSAVRTSEGRIFTWGYNSHGQLGDGTIINKSTPTEITNQFTLGLEEKIMKIKLGSENSSAITSEGRIFTWGNNSYGQLGDGTIINKNIPTEITNQFSLDIGDSIKNISLGNDNSSAITSEGRVFTWGDNEDGLLGDGTDLETYVPIEITMNFNALTIIQNNLALTDTITKISFGSHSAVITSEGRIFTWGSNDVGQLGDGTEIDRYSPIEITNRFVLNTGETIINVFLGYVHSSAITSEGRIFTWGWNGYGRLGDGTTTVQYTPVDITSNFNLNLGETIVDVTLGNSHSSAITSEGRIFTWGSNVYGQLGDGTIDGFNNPLPTEITTNFNLNSEETIIEVNFGDYHSSALSSEGRVFTWGRNFVGQLGYGTIDTDGHPTPTDITANFSLNSEEIIIEIELGDKHSSAITSEGRIFTWGSNSYGQLGDETIIDNPTPTDITSYFSLNTGETFINISLGDYHSSVITSDGRIFSWGRNYYGQLGDGTLIDSNIPIEITDQFTLNIGETFTKVELGTKHSSVLTSNGRIFTWGSNDVGQLGDKTDIDKSTPTNSIFPSINNILLTYVETNIEANDFLTLSLFPECNLNNWVSSITVNGVEYESSFIDTSFGRIDLSIPNTYNVGDSVTFIVESVKFINDEILIATGNVSAITTFVDETSPLFASIDDQTIEAGESNIDWSTLITNEEDNSNGTLIKVEVEDNVDYSTVGTYTVTVKLVDESLNETLQEFNVTVEDTTTPVVEGVTDGQIFEKKSEVLITFNEGTATLNGEDFTTETIITEPGDYELIVTDGSGNITIMTFTIENASNVLLYILIAVGVVVLGVGGFFLARKYILLNNSKENGE